MAADMQRTERRISVKTLPRILIVEDEFLIAIDLSDTVESMGLEISGFARTREEALALAEKADIALVDVNLSDGATGPEIGRILAEDYGVAVFFMTGNPEMVKEGVCGTLGVITKPALPAVLEQAINYAVIGEWPTPVKPSEVQLFSN